MKEGPKGMSAMTWAFKSAPLKLTFKHVIKVETGDEGMKMKMKMRWEGTHTTFLGAVLDSILF